MDPPFPHRDRLPRRYLRSSPPAATLDPRRNAPHRKFPRRAPDIDTMAVAGIHMLPRREQVHLADIKPRFNSYVAWERVRHRQAHWLVECLAEFVSVQSAVVVPILDVSSRAH